MPLVKIQNPIATTERLRKAFRYWESNPVEAVKDWFGVTPEDYQGDMLNALLKPGPNKQNRLAVKSGHGSGKTAFQSWAGWVFMLTRPFSKTVATAPTSHQLMDVLWPEFAKWHARMPKELADVWDISATHIRMKQFDKTWFATARTSNKSDNMQGFHEDHILVIGEESSGIPPEIFVVIEGILSNAEEEGQEALLLLAGNPTQTAGEFYNAFHKNKKLYERFTVCGDPATTGDPLGGQFYHSKRISKKYRDTIAAKYGNPSPVYDVRVLGLFPKMADDVVIPLEWAERAQYRDHPHYDDVADPITLVMDPARFGGNETVLGVFRRGNCLGIHAWPKTSTNMCVDILEEAYKHGAFGVGSVPVARVIVDEPGVGGGVIDGARRADIPITPYHGGLTMKKGVDKDEDVRMFANRNSRDWWYTRRKFELGLISIPMDETLVNQLASKKYDYFNEKIKVETKKEMRERLGEDASPDRADVIVMGSSPVAGVTNNIPLELLDLENNVYYGEERPTSNQDF